MLSFEETLALIRNAKNGSNTAKEELLVNNVLLIKSIVNRFKNKGVDYDAVRDIVRCAFSSRRKMLVNNILNTYKLPRVKVEELLTAAGIPLTVRGENLTAEDYVRLTEIFKEYNIKK